jgi:hypothetical protein
MVKSLLQNIQTKLSNLNKEEFLSKFFFIVALLGLGFRFTNPFSFNPISFLQTDPARHWELAQTAITSDIMTAIDPIAYQSFLSVLARVCGENQLLHAYCAGVLSVTTAVIWYFFFREYLNKKVFLNMAFATLAWLPSWIGIFSYFMTETLLLPLLGLSLFLTCRAAKNGTNGGFLLLCLAWILCSLTRIIALPIGLISVLFVWLIQDQKLKKAFIGISCITVILIPLILRSHFILGTTAPFGLPSMNQIYMFSGKKTFRMEIVGVGNWEYASPSFYSKPLEEIPFLSNWQSQRQGICQVKVDLQKGSQEWQREINNNWPGWKKYLSLWKENLIFFFFGSSWTDNNSKHPIEFWSIKSRFVWLPLFLVVLLGNFRKFHKDKTISWLPTVFMCALCSCLFSPVGVMEGRYRKPIEGLAIANLFYLLAGSSQSEKRGKLWGLNFSL